MEITKISDTEIQVVKTIDPMVETNTYTLDYLLEQQKAIQAQKDAFDIARDAELADIQSMIDQATNLKIMTQAQVEAIPVKEVKIGNTL